MKSIQPEAVQEALNERAGETLYIHLETTNGAYASHNDASFFSAGAFIRNVELRYIHGRIAGEGPYRIGLETSLGWLYAEGLTDWEIDDQDRVLFAGHDPEGRLAAALELSREPFRK
ncbi:YojF family protein [Alkalicoccus chagannorensis]|uniref:YojF family protein n=1 Tax=Alkalicoccus chagannorensis TaxID=427072 RepID=UPI0004121365|nr:YojF family protein [Alkalicoccus chagannorensis]